MADEVTISNLAVAFLGDEATIASISPPEGSDQAEHCAQFFPIARDALLEMHTWDFATRRVSLTLQSETANGWAYAYAKPANCLKVFAVLPPETIDDYSVRSANRGVIQSATGVIQSPPPGGYTSYQPQPFTTEVSGTTGTQLILTNQPEAMGRCVFRATDTGLFTPLFTLSLAKLLASFIAGPIYKGKSGVEMSAKMLEHFQLFFRQATESNSSQEHYDVQVSTPWIAGR